MATKHSGGPGDTKFCISASTEATEMHRLSNSLFLRDQSIGAVFDYPKGIFYVLFIKNVKIGNQIFSVATKFLCFSRQWQPNHLDGRRALCMYLAKLKSLSMRSLRAV